MNIGGPTKQPIGHFMFCKEQPAECRPNGAALPAKPIVLSPKLMAEIARINTIVNADTLARSDEDVYGVEEKWAFPNGEGDCEDYALLKRRLLHDSAGIDYANLLMTVVRKRDGEGHAVLTVRTTTGDFVLDNLDWSVEFWRDTPYAYLKRQDSADPGRWDEIQDGAVVVVSAVAK